MSKDSKASQLTCTAHLTIRRRASYYDEALFTIGFVREASVSPRPLALEENLKVTVRKMQVMTRSSNITAESAQTVLVTVGTITRPGGPAFWQTPTNPLGLGQTQESRPISAKATLCSHGATEYFSAKVPVMSDKDTVI
jgi:hypothetical protein